MNKKLLLGVALGGVALYSGISSALATERMGTNQALALIKNLDPDTKKLIDLINKNGQDFVCKKSGFFRETHGVSGTRCGNNEYAQMALVVCGNYTDGDGAFKDSHCGKKIPSTVGSQAMGFQNKPGSSKEGVSPEAWQAGINNAVNVLSQAIQNNRPAAIALVCATDRQKMNGMTQAFKILANATDCRTVLEKVSGSKQVIPGSLLSQPATTIWEKGAKPAQQLELAKKMKIQAPQVLQSIQLGAARLPANAAKTALLARAEELKKNLQNLNQILDKAEAQKPLTPKEDKDIADFDAELQKMMEQAERISIRMNN
jgi:hypothetical protein